METDDYFLFLRSFVDDDDYGSDGYTPKSSSGEERLVEALQRIAPVFAIGQPNEELPPIGAQRLYYNDDEWQAAVSHLIANATLVVLRPGASSAIVWETEHILDHSEITKFLLYIQNADDYESYRLNTETLFFCQLPATVSGLDLIAFNNNHTPYIPAKTPGFKSWVYKLTYIDHLYDAIVRVYNKTYPNRSQLSTTKLSKGLLLAYGIFLLLPLVAYYVYVLN